MPARSQRSDLFTVFVAVLGVATAFFNIFKFAQKSQPGNAVWAGVALCAFSLLLASQLAKMRQAQPPVSVKDKS